MPFSLRPPAVVIELYWRVTGSLWFVPALFVIGGIALALLVVAAGSPLPQSALKAFPPIEAEAVKDVLKLIASSTMTVATVTFSILMVVLTMTASTFSPRALAGYMRDRINQVTLGVFLGGFAFGVTAASLIRVDDHRQNLLGLLIIVSGAVALLVVATLVYFIHHTAKNVQITNLVLRLHNSADRTLSRFLDALSEESGEPSISPDYAKAAPAAVVARAAGFVQVLAVDDLHDLAIEHNVLIRVLRRAGDFAVRGKPLCEVWPAARLTPALADAVRAAYAVAEQRTSESDPMLGLELMAEVAMRALSPGVNDPNTAVNCLRYLSDLMVRLADQPLPHRVLCDDEGRVRVIVPTPDFREFVERPVLAIASTGCGHLAVVLAIMALLADVAGAATDEARRRQLGDTARAVADRALQTLAFEREREAVRSALQALQASELEPIRA